MERELLDKVLKAADEPIVGNVLFSDSELEHLYSFVRRMLHVFGSVDSQSYKILFVALVNMAKEWDPEKSQFLDFIYKKITNEYLYNTTIYSLLRDSINYLGHSKNIYTVDCGKRYYATICSHALAPISSTYSLFDLCWEIYYKDLNQQYIESDSFFSLIVEALTDRFRNAGNNDDAVSIGSSVYSLRVGIRGMAFNAKTEMTYLINEIVRTIDCLFNEQPVVLDTYCKKLVNSWWQKKISKIGIENERRYPFARGNKAVSDFEQIKAKYIIKDEQLKIVIPVIRFIKNTDIRPYIKITNNKSVFASEYIPTWGSGIVISTTKTEFALNSIDDLSSLRVVINQGDKVIYDSKDSLFRDFVLLDSYREIMSDKTKPGIYFLFTKDNKQLIFEPRSLFAVSKYIYRVIAKDGDFLRYNDRTILFMKEQHYSRNVYLIADKKSGVLYRKNSAEYCVVDGDVKVSVSIKQYIGDIGVRYEDAPFKLTQFPSEEVAGYTRYCITELLDVGQPQKLTVFKYSDGSVLENLSVVKFNNINITFDKPYYYGDSFSGFVEFNTEKYHLSSQFTSSDRSVSLNCEGGEVDISIPWLKWKIDDGEWNYKPHTQGVWFKNINFDSKITIKTIDNAECKLFVNDNEVEKIADGQNVFLFGAAIKRLINNNYSLKTARVLFYFDYQYFDVMNICFERHFNIPPIAIDSKNKKIAWMPHSFVGDYNDSFELVILRQNKQCFKSRLDKKPITLSCDSFENDNYLLQIFVISSGEQKDITPLFQTDFFFGSEKEVRFKHKTIVIKRAVITGDSFFMVKVNNLCIDTIDYLGERDGFDYYSGQMFYYDSTSNKQYIETMIDYNGNKRRINPLRIELKTNLSCYLGYGLDLTDEEFEYDDEFAIDDQKRIVVGTFSSGKKTLPVDYYIFETKETI